MRRKVLPITIIFLISCAIVGGVNVNNVVVESSDRDFHRDNNVVTLWMPSRFNITICNLKTY